MNINGSGDKIQINEYVHIKCRLKNRDVLKRSLFVVVLNSSMKLVDKITHDYLY